MLLKNRGPIIVKTDKTRAHLPKIASPRLQIESFAPSVTCSPATSDFSEYTS